MPESADDHVTTPLYPPLLTSSVLPTTSVRAPGFVVSMMVAGVPADAPDERVVVTEPATPEPTTASVGSQAVKPRNTNSDPRQNLVPCLTALVVTAGTATRSRPHQPWSWGTSRK